MRKNPEPSVDVGKWMAKDTGDADGGDGGQHRQDELFGCISVNLASFQCISLVETFVFIGDNAICYSE